MKKQTLITLLLAVSALTSTSVVQAAVRFEIPDVEKPPFYARIGLNEIYHNDDWAAIVFYRDPSCVPADFNLLEFFDFTPDPDFGLRVFACPMTIEGFVIWKVFPPPPSGPSAPLQAKIYGLGAVPVWFLSWSELQTLVADDVLTIGDLLLADSLRIGSASFYSETLHPTGGATVGHITIDALGQLTGGTQFQFQAAASDAGFASDEECCSSEAKRQHVLIRFR